MTGTLLSWIMKSIIITNSSHPTVPLPLISIPCYTMTPPTPPPPPPPPPVIRKLERIDDEAAAVVESKEADQAHPPLVFSPLQAASDLIQTLDMACSEMSDFTADATKEAEEARRNARTAAEIARSYLHRSYANTDFAGALTPPKHRREETKSPMTDSKIMYGSNHYHQRNSASKPPVPPSPQRRPSLSSSPGRNRASKSADRIAQSHAEEVLVLSMDLERSKQDLESEARNHDETRAALSAKEESVSSLQAENARLKKLLAELEEDHSSKVTELQEEVERSKHFVQVAEEDAQLALDLAKESFEKRDEMEQQLENIKEQLLALKEGQPSGGGGTIHTPRRAVRFEDEASEMDISIVPPTPQFFTPGQDTIREEADDDLSASTPAAKSSAPMVLTRATPPPPPPPPSRITADGLSLEGGFRSAAKVLQESGRRLELSGHWFRKGSANSGFQDMEAMTRQYCQSVEFKVDRQQKEINGLESLCGFLERKLVITGENGDDGAVQP